MNKSKAIDNSKIILALGSDGIVISVDGQCEQK